MNRTEHQAWLAQLAAEDRRRRALAEPELRRKEALLRAAEAKLEATKGALQEAQAELEQARPETDDEPLGED
jgi:hypothetical protein